MTQVLPALFVLVVCTAAAGDWICRRVPQLRTRVRTWVGRAKAEFVFHPLGEAIEGTIELGGGERRVTLWLYGTSAPSTLRLVKLRLEPTGRIRITLREEIALAWGIRPTYPLVPLTIVHTTGRGRPPKRVFTGLVPLLASKTETVLFETSILLGHAMRIQLGGTRLGTLTIADNQPVTCSALRRTPRLVLPPLTFTSQGTLTEPLS